MDEILAVMLRIGEGLTAMHLAGLIHRDINPENIVVGDDEVPKIVDSGLAWNSRQERRISRTTSHRRSTSQSRSRTSFSDHSHTETGHIVGTPAYIPPERFFGEHSGPTSDPFSFCVTLYEAISSRTTVATPPTNNH